MPNTRAANAVRLQFAAEPLVRSNLSGAAFTGEWLWAAGDEACGLDRLIRLDPVGREALRFGEVRDLPLADLLDLRGWSALLEIQVEARADDLRSVPLDNSGTLIRKHFLQLDGLCIRDLHFSGDDLFILAGPTMVLNGDIRVFKWPGARPALAANREPVRFEEAQTAWVAEISDPVLQRKVLRLSLDAARADAHLVDGETLVVDAARRDWQLVHGEEPSSARKTAGLHDA